MPARVYLVEAYASRTSGVEVRAAAERASAAAKAIGPVRYLQSIFVRQEETCFHFFEADAIGTVAELVDRAGIKSDRIVEAEVLRSSTTEARRPS
jgi:hypothetical protein